MSPTLASLCPGRDLILSALADKIGGTLEGPPETRQRVVVGLTTLEEAGPDRISFVSSERFVTAARESRAAAFLVGPRIALGPDFAVVRVQEVWAAVVALLEHFCAPDAPSAFVHPSAVIEPGVVLGRDVSIGPLTVVESGARIGDRVRIAAQVYIGRGASIGHDCVIHPQVAIQPGVEVGHRVICHSGAVLGADGFKYEVIGGRLTKIPQVGTVVIEDDVEVGANTTIDRASLTETRIGARTKIDNLVHLAHNVVVGSDSLIIAQVGVAGSTRIGRGCILAGQVGLADNLVIADGVRIGAQSGVGRSIEEHGDYLGSPALPVREQARIWAGLRQLPELIRQVRALTKEPKEPPGDR